VEEGEEGTAEFLSVQFNFNIEILTTEYKLIYISPSHKSVYGVMPRSTKSWKILVNEVVKSDPAFCN